MKALLKTREGKVLMYVTIPDYIPDAIMFGDKLFVLEFIIAKCKVDCCKEPVYRERNVFRME